MKLDILSKHISYSATSDEIHTPEGVILLNAFYSINNPTWIVELINGKATVITGGQNIVL